MRNGTSILLILLMAVLSGVATASTAVVVMPVAPSDSTAGPFVIHVRVSPENYPNISRVVCVVEAVSDSATVSKAWGRLEAGDKRLPSAIWCSLASDEWAKKPDRIRFAFGLRRDLADVSTATLDERARVASLARSARGTVGRGRACEKHIPLGAVLRVPIVGDHATSC